jgi:tripeptidyl-peptidase-1
MIARAASILLASAALAWASPYQVKEFHPVPRGWTQLGQAPRTHSIQLEIGLRQSRFDELEKNLYEGMLRKLCENCVVPLLVPEA